MYPIYYVDIEKQKSFGQNAMKNTLKILVSMIFLKCVKLQLQIKFWGLEAWKL